MENVKDSIDSLIEKWGKDTAFETMLDIFCGLFDTDEECIFAREYCRQIGYNI